MALAPINLASKDDSCAASMHESHQYAVAHAICVLAAGKPSCKAVGKAAATPQLLVAQLLLV